MSVRFPPIVSRGLPVWRLVFVLLLLFCLPLTACGPEARIKTYIHSLSDHPSSSRANIKNPYAGHESLVAKLVAIGEPAVLPLLAALENPENSLQHVYVAKALGQIGDARAIEPIYEAYQNNSEHQAVLLEALIALAPEDPRTTGAAIQGLGEGGAHEEVARAYLISQGIQNNEYWIEGLTYKGESRRQHTAELLMELGGLPAAQVMAGSLISDDVEVLTTVLDTLSEMIAGEAAADLNNAMNENIPRLVELVDHPDEYVSDAATSLLSALTGPEAFEALYNLSEQGDWDIRIIILGKLVDQDDPRAREALWEALLADDDMPVHYLDAILNLMKQAGEYRIEPIVEALNSTSEQVRYNAVTILGKTGDPQALPTLRELALSSSESETFRLSAVWGLGNLGLPAAVPNLVDLLDDPNERIQNQAFAGLRSNGSPEAITAHIRVCRDEQSDFQELSCLHLATLERSQVESLLAAISRRDLRMIAEAYPFYIAWGEEGSEAVLIQALEQSDNKSMAVDFLNCGNAALASAAEEWAKDHGYSVFSLPGSGGTGWGSGK